MQNPLRLAPTYGLLILMVGPTALNLRSILGDKAIIALLALAVTIPMAAGRIDLTVGSAIVLWHILVIGLQTVYGLPKPVAGRHHAGFGRDRWPAERFTGRSGTD